VITPDISGGATRDHSLQWTSECSVLTYPEKSIGSLSTVCE
jgi:hypothetical protein